MKGTPESVSQRHDLWVAGVVLLAAFLLEWLDIDRAIARAFFYQSAAHGWIGTGAGTGGRTT
jgi:hypothetical protein